MLSFWPFSAQAQFVCGGSADGSEPQTGAGADATAAGGNTNMACGTNANASGLARPQQAASEWAKLPRMQLERQFAGPLQDTIVQRWRDPADGTICYIYLPITRAALAADSDRLCAIRRQHHWLDQLRH